MKNRRGYFMVTSVVVGSVFFAAVVISIFAADFSLGNKGFEMVELIAPVDIPRSEPAPPRQQPQPKTSAPSASKLPTRTDHVQALMETPRQAPSISTTPSAVKARPLDSRYEIGPLNTDPVGGTTGRDTPGTGAGTGTDGGGLSDTTVADTKPIEPPPPPPIRQPEPVRKPPVQSKGVINGMATNLPKPTYSAAAKAVNAQGAVNVQVLIDESGRVVSANAVSGHPLLRSAAENAARSARFTPTKLSDVPVKVSGVIVYNFQRSS